MSEEFDGNADIEEFMGSMAEEADEDELNVVPGAGGRGNSETGEEDDEYDHDEEEDDLNLSDSELNIIKQYELQHEKDEENKNNKEKEKDTDGRLYQDDLCKPVAQVGNVKLGLSKAKLFGLKIDENGKVDLTKNREGGQPHCPSKKHMQNLSKPREAAPVEEEKLAFQPTRNKEALAAMKNKGCGYDFVERLENGSDFMTRLEQGGGGNKAAAAIPKAKLESMEADYAVSQDKLQCPGCKKYQSFDELIEKKRTCGQCRLRYQKLNITSGAGFANRAKEAEEKKLARLKKIEQEMYGGTSSANKSTVGKVLSTREKAAAETAGGSKNRGNGGTSSSTGGSSSSSSKPHAATSRPQSKGTSINNDDHLHPHPPHHHSEHPSDAKPALRGNRAGMGAKDGSRSAGGRGSSRSIVVDQTDMNSEEVLQLMAENHIDNYISEKDLLESLQNQILGGGGGSGGGVDTSVKKGRGKLDDARMAKKLQKGLL